MSEIIGGLIGATAGGAAGGMVQRRRAKRLRSVDRLECSIRVATGTHDGLSGKWWGGTATLSSGRIRFVPIVGGFRFLRRKAVEIQVDKIDVGERRSPSGREVLSIDPSAYVVRLVTPTATLEWAVPQGQLSWALGVMSGG